MTRGLFLILGSMVAMTSSGASRSRMGRIAAPGPDDCTRVRKSMPRPVQLMAVSSVRAGVRNVAMATRFSGAGAGVSSGRSSASVPAGVAALGAAAGLLADDELEQAVPPASARLTAYDVRKKPALMAPRYTLGG